MSSPVADRQIHVLVLLSRFAPHISPPPQSAGSILAALKEKRFANSLSSYSSPSQLDFAFFNVSIDLTDEGMQNIEAVVGCVFAYIGMLKREGPQQWVWDEMKDTADMSFRFQNKGEPSDYGRSIVFFVVVR